MIHNPARLPLPALVSPGSASDLRSGKQLVGADGSVVTGTLAEVTQATPSISVSSGGLITATATQSGGIVASGSKSATKQLPTQAAKTVTPGTTNQTAVASGRYTTGAVTVKGDANLKEENIAEGVSIFGVSGTHKGATPEYTALSNSAFSGGWNQIIITLPKNCAQLLSFTCCFSYSQSSSAFNAPLMYPGFEPTAGKPSTEYAFCSEHNNGYTVLKVSVTGNKITLTVDTSDGDSQDFSSSYSFRGNCYYIPE